MGRREKREDVSIEDKSLERIGEEVRGRVIALKDELEREARRQA